MESKDTREKLISLLDTLKRNLAAVPREVLKTKYKKPYDVLAKDICTTATDYVKQITLQGVRIRRDYLPDIQQIVESAGKQSGLLKQISKAAFLRQDINEIDTLALSLRKQIHGALEEFYGRHMGYYLAEECFEDSPKQPVPYNAVTDSILVNDVWIPLENKTPPVVNDNAA